MSSCSVITSDFVNLSITNSGQESCYVERRFQKGITIHEFKVSKALLSFQNFLLHRNLQDKIIGQIGASYWW